jgi:hypothetical protein
MFPLTGEFAPGYGNVFAESPFTESEEIQLAMELLEVSNEEELDQFLGKLFKGVWKGLKKFGRFVGKVVRPLGKVLKFVAKKALPFLGGALGSLIPVPGVGTALGSALGKAVGGALEMEFAEMDPEDRELEMARRFVRIAGTAARNVALAPLGADLEEEIRAAVVDAAKQHVPGLAMPGGPAGAPAAPPWGAAGRWYRSGEKIIVVGV